MLVIGETLHDSHPPVQLPHLRSITIRPDPSILFEKLVVPGLQEVSIIFFGSHMDSDTPAYFPLLTMFDSDVLLPFGRPRPPSF